MVNKSRTIIVCILIIFILICASIFIFVGIGRNQTNIYLKSIEQETDEAVNCLVNGTLHTKDETYDLYKLCMTNDKNLSYEEILCIHNNRVYFVYQEYSENDNLNWMIASVGLENKEILIHCKMENVSMNYSVERTNDYSIRNAYYFNGKIVLNDYHSILEYDINLESAESFEYANYKFPKREFNGEYVDSQTIELSIGSESKIITLYEMAKKSESISKIYGLKDKKIWSGDSSIQDFFSDSSVQVINGKIYVIGSCLNFSGEAYALIFEYIYDEDVWRYIKSIYVGGLVEGNCYLIPEI